MGRGWGARFWFRKVQIDHDARPSVSINIVHQFGEYLRDTAKGNPSMPDSLQKLQNEAGIRLILANTEDPDAIGCFKQYRVAFYTEPCLNTVHCSGAIWFAFC